MIEGRELRVGQLRDSEDGKKEHLNDGGLLVMMLMMMTTTTGDSSHRRRLARARIG